MLYEGGYGGRQDRFDLSDLLILLSVSVKEIQHQSVHNFS